VLRAHVGVLARGAGAHRLAGIARAASRRRTRWQRHARRGPARPRRQWHHRREHCALANDGIRGRPGDSGGQGRRDGPDRRPKRADGEGAARRARDRAAKLPRADAYTKQFPFLTKLSLPAGTVSLSANLPPQDAILLAPAATLVVRSDFHPALVDL